MDSADFKCHSRICKDSESLFLRSQSYPFSVSEQQLHAKVVMMLVILFKSPMFRLKNHLLSLANSVTRLGDILLLRRLFKACGNDYFSRNCPHFWAIFEKVSFFLWKYFCATFYRRWATFNSSLLVTLAVAAAALVILLKMSSRKYENETKRKN